MEIRSLRFQGCWSIPRKSSRTQTPFAFLLRHPSHMGLSFVIPSWMLHCKNGDMSIWEEEEKVVTDVHAGRIFAFLSRKKILQGSWGSQMLFRVRLNGTLINSRVLLIRKDIWWAASSVYQLSYGNSLLPNMCLFSSEWHMLQRIFVSAPGGGLCVMSLSYPGWPISSYQWFIYVLIHDIILGKEIWGTWYPRLLRKRFFPGTEELFFCLWILLCEDVLAGAMQWCCKHEGS